MSEPFMGTVMIWAPNFAPRGWAFCQGQIMAISNNTAMFSLLGTVYGGNGQTTFGLPNLQGRVPVGQGQSPGTSDYALGEMSGTETTTLTTSQMPMHTHASIFTPTGSLPNVKVTLNATSTSAATDKPQTDYMLSDAAPTTTKIYAPKDNNTVALGGIVTEVTGPLPGGTVAIQTSGGSQPFNNLQPYQVLNYVIALEGVFPSRQ